MNIQYIIAEYVRREHAERSQNYFKRLFAEDKNYAEGVIEERLYALVGIISSLHTESFDKIFECLPCEEVAMGDEHIHPRFAAAMLRIGDLLDMDNNRFNIRILEHRGSLPPGSMAHLRKHKALRHFEINEFLIYAEAYSDNFEACLETRRWYNWIEAEFGDLIKNWNRLVPWGVGCCHLKKCVLKVYLNGRPFTTQDLNYFNFDSRKMQKLLIGDNIYDCRLDCLREYVQNAIDATKVLLWKRLTENSIDSPLRKSVPLHELLPCDLKEEAFLRMPIEVLFSYEKSGSGLMDDKICIEIKDRGIGMDRACVNGITTIGKGWRAREEYHDVFSSAPKWLQPTGGFGIGIQSAFMITDEVIYETCSEKEEIGHRIRLISPERSGNVTREDISKTIVHGTSVEFRVSAIKFMNFEEFGGSETFVRQIREITADSNSLLNMFNQTYILERAIAICKKYLLDQIPNAVFPIYIGEKNTKPERIISPYLYMQVKPEKSATTQPPLTMLPFQSCMQKDEQSGKQYRYFYHIDINEKDVRGENNSRIIIWNTQFMDCVCFSFSCDTLMINQLQNHRDNIPATLDIAFKNIAVSKEKRYFNCCNTFLDIMGERAELCLQVSRSKLKNDFEDSLNKRLTLYLKFALSKLIPQYLNIKKGRPGQVLQGSPVKTGEKDIVATWDFVRMVFCGLTYLEPSEIKECLQPTKEIGKFNQEIFDYIDWKLHLKSNDTHTEKQEKASAPQNMLEHCENKLASVESSHPEVFFCADNYEYLEIPDKQSIQSSQEPFQVDSDKLYDALEYLLNSAGSIGMIERQYTETEKNINTVYRYLINEKERIFGTVWGDAVFGSQIGEWKKYHRVRIESRKFESSGKSCFVSPLTVYFRKREPVDGSRSNTKLQQLIYYNDKDLLKKYPLAVSRVPHQPALPKEQWAIISPSYTALREKLAELKQKCQANEESAIRDLLDINENFHSLVDWVYCFQKNEPNQGYHTKEEIWDIYTNWVLEEYYSSDTDNDFSHEISL